MRPANLWKQARQSEGAQHLASSHEMTGMEQGGINVPLEASVGERSATSARWTVAQNLAKQAVDLCVFLVLAKLLDPAAFGLVAMAGAIIVLVNVFSEMGMGEALLQRERLSPGHLNSAFWALTLIASIGALSIWMIAPYAGASSGHQEVSDLLRALTPLFFMQAFAVVPQALLQRELKFRQLALRSMCSSIAGAAVGLTMAFHGAGAWSLIAQQLCAGGIGLIFVFCLSHWRPQWQASREAARQLLAFGRSILANRFLNVAASKMDDLAVGMFLGPVALGAYTVGCRMLLALEQLFCQGVDALALSTFSKVASDKTQLRCLFLSASRAAAVLAAPVFCGLSMLVPELLTAVLGEKWLQSAWVLQVLLFAGLIHAVSHFNHAVFKACGQPELSVKVAAYSTGLNFMTLLIGVQFGVVAVAGSYLVRSLLIAPVGLRMVASLLEMPLKDYFAGLVQPLLAVSFASMSVAALKFWLPMILPQLHPVAQLFVLGLIGASIYLIWMLIFAAHDLKAAIGMKHRAGL